MSLISGLKSFGKKAGLASLGPVGLLAAKKKAGAEAQAGPQPAGQKGVGVGKALLKGLLGPFAGKLIK